jgi:hypothetical protein
MVYGSEIRRRTLKEEHKLRVYAYRVLREVLGPKEREVRGHGRKLRDE